VQIPLRPGPTAISDRSEEKTLVGQKAETDTYIHIHAYVVPFPRCVAPPRYGGNLRMYKRDASTPRQPRGHHDKVSFRDPYLSFDSTARSLPPSGSFPANCFSSAHMHPPT
jgi:hypothetical protein